MRNQMKSKKERKNLLKCMALAMMLSVPMTTGFAMQQANTQVVEAATASISNSSISLKIGKTKKLSIKNTTKKVTWSSSNKKVATVTKNGKVRAVSKGTATITATVSGKKYTCKVTVKALTAKENLDKVVNAIKKAYGNDYAPNSSIDATIIREITGLQTTAYDAWYAQGPMVSHQVDTLIAVHAKTGKAAWVESALWTYRGYLINDSFQYPSNIAKVNASEVVRVGDYVFFIMLGKPMSNMDATEKQQLTYYKEQNKIAIKAIQSVLE